jgi:GIY-YIG catalytic domain
LQAGSQGFESPCLQPRKLSGLSRRSRGEGGHLFGLLHFSRELRLGKPVMKQFFYVYILQSEVDPQQFYTGLTDDLRTRLKNHNSGRISI